MSYCATNLRSNHSPHSHNPMIAARNPLTAIQFHRSSTVKIDLTAQKYVIRPRRVERERGTLRYLLANTKASEIQREKTMGQYPYFVYILLCADGSYYTGYSNDPAQRFGEHLSGRGARYTRMHRPTGIVYLQGHKTRRDAMARERKIKTLTHEAKRKLIQAAT